MKKCKNIILKNMLLILLPLAMLISCKPADQLNSMHQKKTESGISDFTHLDYENVDHLVLMHKTATTADIQFSKDSMQLAEQQVREQGYLFPRIQLEEALTSYPTPEIVIEFANSFLNVAQYYLSNEVVSLKKPLGDNDIQWYLEGAHFFLKLAMDFSKKIDRPFNRKTSDKIRLTMNCISQILTKEVLSKSSISLCKKIDL
jgi:hypothetical protein